MSRILLRELTTAPATPVTGKLAVYCKNDGKLYVKNAAGVETAVGGGTGGGAVTVDPLELAHRTVNIGGTTGKTKLFAKDDNQLYFTDGNGAVSRVARFSEIPAVPVIDPLALTERATDPASQTGKVVVYGKTDNRLYARGEDGVISKLAFVSEIAAASGPINYIRTYTPIGGSSELAYGALLFVAWDAAAVAASSAAFSTVDATSVRVLQSGVYRTRFSVTVRYIAPSGTMTEHVVGIVRNGETTPSSYLAITKRAVSVSGEAHTLIGEAIGTYTANDLLQITVRVPYNANGVSWSIVNPLVEITKVS